MLNKIKSLHAEIMAVVNDHPFLVGVGVGVLVTMVLGHTL